MVEFLEAIKRPLKTDLTTVVLGSAFMAFHVLGGALTVIFGTLVGGLLSLLSVLTHGLGIEASRRTIRNDHSMPRFDDYVDLFFSGLMVWVIFLLYFLPAMIVILFGVANSFPLVYGVFHNIIWQPLAAVQGFLLLILSGAVYGLIALVLGILALLMFPIAVQFYAKNKQLGDAFKFPEILNVVATKEYWMSWAVAAGYGVVLIGIATIISTLSLFTLLIPAFGFASYLWIVTWYTLFADVTHQVMGTHKHPTAKHHASKATHHKKGRFAARRK